MANDRDRIAQRLATLSAAKPLTAPPPAKKSASSRSEERRKVYRHGKLVISGQVDIDCMIVDWSANGARVLLQGAAALPEYLTLKVIATGEWKRARVAWRSDSAAGVSFRIEQAVRFGQSGTATTR